jgi:hypothetical protein
VKRKARRKSLATARRRSPARKSTARRGGGARHGGAQKAKAKLAKARKAALRAALLKKQKKKKEQALRARLLLKKKRERDALEKRKKLEKKKRMAREDRERRRKLALKKREAAQKKRDQIRAKKQRALAEKRKKRERTKLAAKKKQEAQAKARERARVQAAMRRERAEAQKKRVRERQLADKARKEQRKVALRKRQEAARERAEAKKARTKELLLEKKQKQREKKLLLTQKAKEKKDQAREAAKAKKLKAKEREKLRKERDAQRVIEQKARVEERARLKAEREAQRIREKAEREAERERLREEAKRKKEEERAQREAEREAYRKAKEAEQARLRAEREAARRALEGRVVKATRASRAALGRAGGVTTTRVYTPSAIPDQSGTRRAIEGEAPPSNRFANLRVPKVDPRPGDEPTRPIPRTIPPAPPPPPPASIEDRYAKIKERIQLTDDAFRAEYEDNLLISWIYHDSALEGVVYTYEELRMATNPNITVVPDSSLQTVCDEIKRHKAAIEFVREQGEKKRVPINIDTMKRIYLILHPEEGDLKTVKYRKDIPQHRLYFHEYAAPDKIAYKVRQVFDWLNGPEPKKIKNAVRIAARAHYDLLRVFPFPLDSGKVARLFMNLLLLRADCPPALIHSTERQRYYEALRGSLPTINSMVNEAIVNALTSVEKRLDERQTKLHTFG